MRPLSRGWWSAENPARYDLDEQPLCDSARRYECGTLTTVAAYGLLEALRLLNEAGVAQISARIEKLTAVLAARLCAHGCVVYRDEGPDAWSGIVSFEVPGRDAREVARTLEDARVFVNPRGGRLRAAVHAWNDTSDVDRLLEALPRP